MPNKQPIVTFNQKFRNWYRHLAYDISVMAQKDFVQNFKRQGYNSSSGLNKWADRKKVNGKRQKKDGILIQSGRLMRSLRPEPLTTAARVVTDVEYAQRHNEGFKGIEYVKPHKRIASRTVKTKGSYGKLGDEKKKGKKQSIMGARHNVSGFARKVNTPARPFMITSPQLLNEIEDKVLNDLEKMFFDSL